MRSSSPVAVLALLVATACGANGSGDGTGPVGSVRSAVVGGYIDRETTGVVGLAISSPGHFFLGHCSGTLIAPNLVLTARHCVSLTEGTPNEQVRCGVSEFAETGRGDMYLASPETVRPRDPEHETWYRGVQVRVPPGSNDFCGHDIALIVLGENIPPSEATPVEPRLDSMPSRDELFSADGFGLTGPDEELDTSGTRMRLDGNTVRCAGTDCRTVTDLVRPTEWMSLDAQICPGDSGGPALDSEGRVMGVASRGADGCSSAIYGDVASWRDLIVTVAIDAAERGDYPVPEWAADGSVDGGGVFGGPLGRSCSGKCSDDYVCYSANSQPPGTCVPRCASADDECPTNYACNAEIKACVPLDSGEEDDGCAVGSARGASGSNAALVAVFSLAAALLRRRLRR